MVSYRITKFYLLMGFLLLSAAQAYAASDASYQRCLLERLEMSYFDRLSVAELKRQCRNIAEPEPVQAIRQLGSEEVRGISPFGDFNDFFEPYKESRLLMGSMRNSSGSEPFSGKTLDVKFDLGLKFRMFPNNDRFAMLAPLYFGYSQQSWWDVAESSAPFREHNYNPEVFWDFSRAPNRDNFNQLGRLVDKIGYEHQSNGRAGAASRSWDRFYAERRFQLHDKLALRVKAWNVTDLGRENDDITDYLGNVKLTTDYTPSERLRLRLGLQKGHETSKYSYQLDLIFRVPAWLNSDFMLSYYDGYGEGLISFNEKSQSLRAGLFFPIRFAND